ncbi:Hypothetical protein CB129slpB_0249 [Propionibacterium freudenreichii]|nr:Hypothetical protein CB129slpB_0249 [Propionibacterium freudenreichii]
MTQVHPVTAFLAVASLVAVAIAGANPLIMALAVVALALLSSLAAGPRRACFVDAALTAIVVVAIWLAFAVLVDQSDTRGAVVLTLPRRQLGAGVAIGGVKTVTWLEQMALRGVGAGLVVLGLGLLAQLRPARTWLNTISMLFGRWTDLVAPLVCLPEAVLATRRLDAPARRLARSARAARAGVARRPSPRGGRPVGCGRRSVARRHGSARWLARGGDSTGDAHRWSPAADCPGCGAHRLGRRLLRGARALAACGAAVSRRLAPARCLPAVGRRLVGPQCHRRCGRIGRGARRLARPSAGPHGGDGAGGACCSGRGGARACPPGRGAPCVSPPRLPAVHIARRQMPPPNSTLPGGTSSGTTTPPGPIGRTRTHPGTPACSCGSWRSPDPTAQ